VLAAPLLKLLNRDVEGLSRLVLRPLTNLGSPSFCGVLTHQPDKKTTVSLHGVPGYHVA
jgi:hypothetical protein